MKKSIIFFLSVFIFTSISAQNTKEFVNSHGFSHTLNNYEKNLAKDYPKTFHETAPPEGEVRNIAEWEQMESVIIAYDSYDGFGIPYSLISAMADYVNVTVLVANSTEEATVRNLFTSNGVNQDNCTFIYKEIDSWWSRDYSPWSIAVDNETVSIVDFPYNRPRPNDDDTPESIANFYSIPYYGMDVTQTGGNYMTDGYGISAATDLVYDENTLTPAQIATKMNDYLGIETYLVVADPLDDYIKHIDCWGKFLDVDKILITQVPESDYRYDDFEASATYFENQNCSYGYPYKVIRVQADSYSANYDTPYTNSLILNGKVFVPQTGSPYDDDALAVYEEAMPGYEIIGVTAGSASWMNTDALHCRTHGIADREMLFVKHYPLFDTLYQSTPFEINAEVYSYAGNDLQAGFPKLNYKINDSIYHSIEMTETKANYYTASIPVYNGENMISYYIEAKDVENITANNPLMADQDPHIFYSNTTTTNFNKVKSADIVKIYPNPNKGNFYLDIDVKEAQNVNIEIKSITGQTVYSESQFIQSNGDVIRMNIDNLQIGIYLINTKTNNQIYTTKLIIK